MKAELKPEELRCGNLIEYKGKAAPIVRIDSLNELKEVGYIGSVTVAEYDDDGRTIWNYNAPWLAQIKPIELSEEWLKKAGFEWYDEEESNYDWGYKIGDFKISQMDFGAGLLEDREYHLSEPDIQIKTVHQLQNLYYALTGNELIFNHG